MLFYLWNGAGFGPEKLLQFFPFAFPKEQNAGKKCHIMSHLCKYNSRFSFKKRQRNSFWYVDQCQ